MSAPPLWNMRRWTRSLSISTASAFPWWCGMTASSFSLPRARRKTFFATPGSVTMDGAPHPFDEGRRAEAAATFQKLSADGFRVLGVAVRKVEQQAAYALADERDMTLTGFAAFLDPPKEGIVAVLEALKQNGVSVVIMTGDNQYVTQKVPPDAEGPPALIFPGAQVHMPGL